MSLTTSTQQGTSYDRFRRAFADMTNMLDDPSHPERLDAAVSLWMGYPLYGEMIECHSETSIAEKYSLRGYLDAIHCKAINVLCVECEGIQINCGPLAEAGRVCRELFRSVRRGRVEASSPYGVVWFVHPNSTGDTWPECLGELRYALPQAMQEAIRRGEEAMRRLDAILQLNPPPSWQVTKEAVAPTAIIDATEVPKPDSHAPDFSWVQCDAGHFEFNTPGQRGVIACLWHDWECGGTGLSQDYIVENAGVSGRLRAVLVLL